MVPTISPAATIASSKYWVSSSKSFTTARGLSRSLWSTTEQKQKRSAETRQWRGASASASAQMSSMHFRTMLAYSASSGAECDVVPSSQNRARTRSGLKGRTHIGSIVGAMGLTRATRAFSLWLSKRARSIRSSFLVAASAARPIPKCFSISSGFMSRELRAYRSIRLASKPSPPYTYSRMRSCAVRTVPSYETWWSSVILTCLRWM